MIETKAEEMQVGDEFTNDGGKTWFLVAEVDTSMVSKHIGNQVTLRCKRFLDEDGQNVVAHDVVDKRYHRDHRLIVR